MKLLVTGGAGFIGCNFVRYWQKANPEDFIVVLDKLTYAGSLDNLKGVSNTHFKFVEGDICDQPLVESLLEEFKLDTIVHFAAESHVDRSIAGPDIFVETNIMGTHALLKAARKKWLTEKIVDTHRFHHVSTDEVYGSLELNDEKFTEKTPYKPSSPYSASKAASDHLVWAYHTTYGLNVTLSNCSNNYGAFQHIEKLIPRTILHLLEGKPMGVYGDGQNIRDWLYVDEHCRAIELILKKGKSGDIFNIGTDCEKNNVEVVKAIAKALCALYDTDAHFAGKVSAELRAFWQSDKVIHFIDDRLGHDRRYAIDNSLIKNQLSFEPVTSFEAALYETVRWYVSQSPLFFS
jgi:dTDP-glucose 4,6-dehydratase